MLNGKLISHNLLSQERQQLILSSFENLANLSIQEASDFKQKFSLLDTQLEEVLLSKYYWLSKLRSLRKERNKLSRYEHTLLLVKSMMAIVNADYDLFIRYDRELEEKRNEHPLTLCQFSDLCEKSGKYIKGNLLFFLTLCITHDYGIIDGNNARHFVNSIKYCFIDFQRLGFSTAEIKFAQLLVGNHSFLGDLLLGEATLAYLFESMAAAKAIDAKYEAMFLPYLWILTVLDINSSGVGYLTSEKYEHLESLYTLEGIEKIKNNFHEQRLQYLLGHLPTLAVDRDFDQVYLQYLHNIVNAVEEKNRIIPLEKLVAFFNLLTIVWKETNSAGRYRYITFHDDSIQTAREILKRINSPDYVQFVKITENEGLILGYPYSVTGLYLEILNNRF